jgi:ArsR family transcriptional regulator, arsenate/arsenite/antimonite-responsive transcriptional repressor
MFKPKDKESSMKAAKAARAARAAKAPRGSAAAKPAGVPVDQVARTFEACTPLFFALGERPRQQILLLLTENPELNVNQFAERLPLSRPAISHHLKILRQAGLVGVVSHGTENRYHLAVDDAIALLERFVAEVKACGD